MRPFGRSSRNTRRARRREEALWETLSAEELGRRRDEMLLPVGRAAGVLLNLLVREGGAKRILEVGSSYGYSTHWLADGGARRTAASPRSNFRRPRRTTRASG